MAEPDRLEALDARLDAVRLIQAGAEADLDVDPVARAEARHRGAADVLDVDVQPRERHGDLRLRPLVPLRPARVIRVNRDRWHLGPVAGVPARPNARLAHPASHNRRDVSEHTGYHPGLAA